MKMAWGSSVAAFAEVGPTPAAALPQHGPAAEPWRLAWAEARDAVSSLQRSHLYSSREGGK